MVEHKGGFFAVDRKTGREKWGLALPAIPEAFISGVVSSPAVGEGLVYFGSVDGTFYALPAP